jgi:hypothetical protein
MLDTLHKDNFVAYLNHSFQIRLDGIDPIDLELVNVNVLGQANGPGERQPFSLHFLGPVSPQYLLQHTYALEHPKMGVLELFIVPLGPEAGRMRYEAIIT